MSEKKPKPFLYILAAVGFMFSTCGISFAVLVSQGKSGQKQETQSQERLTELLFGRSFSLGEPLGRYDSLRSLKGQGSTIAKYQIPQAFQDALTPWSEHLLGRPKADSMMVAWTIVPWHQGRPSASDSELVSFALDGLERYSGVNSSEGKGLKADLKLLLRSNECWLAYAWSKDESARLANVDLYALDPGKALLYYVNTQVNPDDME